MTTPIRLGMVGFGKIAQSQHLAAIRSNAAFELVAVTTLDGQAGTLPTYSNLPQMLAKHAEIDAVVMCQPPAARFAPSMEAIRAGKHVFLEKPPGTTVGEVRMLEAEAAHRGVTMFIGWHSRWAEPVERLRAWCQDREISSVRIDWMEDVRIWHPGQDWIWQPGGFGVLDPGINALSILTAVVPGTLRVRDARFEMPSNQRCPIAARLVLEAANGALIEAEFDWRQTGPQLWRMEFIAGHETYVFQQGAPDDAAADDDPVVLANEYEAMYAHFGSLIRNACSDVDCSPLEIVADACLVGETIQVEAFKN